MKRFLTAKNILLVLALSFSANCFVLVREFPYLLLAVIPLFLIVNGFAGASGPDTTRIRLKLLHHGGVLLSIFGVSLIFAVISQLTVTFVFVNNDIWTIVWSVLWCFVAEAFVFVHAITVIYCTSAQMGITFRIIAFLAGFIPVLNIFMMIRIVNVVLDEVEVEIDRDKKNKLGAKLELCKTKYPLLLVHGVFFRDYKYFNYWGRIPKTLIKNGAKIYYGDHQSARPVAESARELYWRIKMIVEDTGCEKVNVIAHSKGGLDIRYAMSEFPDIAPYIASLTTINTPHRGCLFADRLLGTAPTKLKMSVSKTYNFAMRRLGDSNPDFLAAVTDLTAEACAERNEKLKIPDGVYCRSVGSVLNHASNGRFPLNLSHRYVKKYDGPNDGLVGESSFEWGEDYRLIRVNGKRGVSHSDMTDLNRDNIKDFDVRGFYVDLVHELKEKGL